MINVIMLALFVEAIVSAVKPIWKADGKAMTVTEIVSIVLGIVLALGLKIDLLGALVDVDVFWDGPKWIRWVFYAMSGVAIGRGPSFVYDFWGAMKKWRENR